MDERLDHAPCGYLSMDRNLTVRTVNATLCRLLEYEKLGINGISIESLLNRSSQIFFRIYFLPLIQLNHHVNEMYLMMKTSSGGTLPVLLNAVIREREGESVYDCVLIPMLRRKEYEEQIEQAENTYRRLENELKRMKHELEKKKGEAVFLRNPEI